jgi:prolyl-tRNA synthetase
MVRAGLVRQLGAGLWTWLPAGWRVHENVVQIVREEMDAIGSQEMLAPLLTPRDLWRRSGRDVIDEVFKLEDRRGAPMILALSHEEAFTYHVAQVVRSYRDLPLLLYHFQTKERDEARPRAGILRTREFIMKDAYSFDRDRDGLDESYAKYVVAYDRVFDRVGLEWYRVESDVGVMGGFGAHEYMAPCPAGENDIALAPGYAANVEVASAQPSACRCRRPGAEPATCRRRDDDDRRGARPPVAARGRAAQGVPRRHRRRGMLMVVVRGDHRVNEIKLQNALGAPFRPAQPERSPSASARPGSSARWASTCPSCSTGRRARRLRRRRQRARRHTAGVEPGRDFAFETVDVRTVEAGDTVDGKVIRIEPAIEVGNIFKLGTRYSEPLGATYLDESGQRAAHLDGLLRHRPARIAAAAVEQYHDEKGISWPRAIAPVAGRARRPRPARHA